MTYDEFIQNIINTRGRFGITEGYKERHHILPKFLNGTDTEDNLIDLYAYEHYIAHKLLVEKYPDNRSIVIAFSMMTHCTSAVTNDRDYIITPEDYSLAREAWNNTSMSDETKNKLSEIGKSKIGELNNFYGHHHSEESKMKISLSKSGKYIGELNPNFGSGTNHWNESSSEKFRKRMLSKSSEELQSTRQKAQDTFNSRPLKERLEINRKKTAKWKESRKKPVYCIETGKTFSSITEASKFYKCNVGQALKTNGTAGGYHWNYIEKELHIDVR